jgi:hypothetical protein
MATTGSSTFQVWFQIEAENQAPGWNSVRTSNSIFHSSFDSNCCDMSASASGGSKFPSCTFQSVLPGVPLETLTIEIFQYLPADELLSQCVRLNRSASAVVHGTSLWQRYRRIVFNRLPSSAIIRDFIPKCKSVVELVLNTEFSSSVPTLSKSNSTLTSAMSPLPLVGPGNISELTAAIANTEIALVTGSAKNRLSLSHYRFWCRFLTLLDTLSNSACFQSTLKRLDFRKAFPFPSLHHSSFVLEMKPFRYSEPGCPSYLPSRSHVALLLAKAMSVLFQVRSNSTVEALLLDRVELPHILGLVITEVRACGQARVEMEALRDDDPDAEPLTENSPQRFPFLQPTSGTSPASVSPFVTFMLANRQGTEAPAAPVLQQKTSHMYSPMIAFAFDHSGARAQPAAGSTSGLLNILVPPPTSTSATVPAAAEAPAAMSSRALFQLTRTASVVQSNPVISLTRSLGTGSSSLSQNLRKICIGSHGYMHLNDLLSFAALPSLDTLDCGGRACDFGSSGPFHATDAILRDAQRALSRARCDLPFARLRKLSATVEVSAAVLFLLAVGRRRASLQPGSALRRRSNERTHSTDSRRRLSSGSRSSRHSSNVDCSLRVLRLVPTSINSSEPVLWNSSLHVNQILVGAPALETLLADANLHVHGSLSVRPFAAVGALPAASDTILKHPEAFVELTRVRVRLSDLLQPEPRHEVIQFIASCPALRDIDIVRSAVKIEPDLDSTVLPFRAAWSEPEVIAEITRQVLFD